MFHTQLAGLLILNKGHFDGHYLSEAEQLIHRDRQDFTKWRDDKF
jgi:hypothetical protein